MNRLLGLSFGSIVVMAIVALMFGGMSNGASAPDVPQFAAASRKSGGDDIELVRDPSGRFHLAAVVNGEDASFLLDTGADTVALTMADAERLGIPVDPNNLQPVVETASGVGNGAAVKIERLTIGGQDFRDVDAMVIEGLGVNLLGRPLISKLGTLEMQGNRMVLKQN
jgi:aspartyl protease family protein